MGPGEVPMHHSNPERVPAGAREALSRRIEAVQRWLCAIYRLDIPLQASRFLVDAERARALLPQESPRSGVLVCEEGGDLWLGLYLDAHDQADPGTVVEETSHLLCVAWNALQERRISRLCLELQADVDRYVLARLTGGPPMAHFEGVRFLPSQEVGSRERYRTSHRAAYRYCRRLSRRFPQRADTPGLLAELRDFYRMGPQRKLRVALH